MMPSAPMLLVGRILLATLFLVAGIGKLTAVAGTVSYFAKLGLPAPQAMVWLTIAVEIGGAVLLILGWKTRQAAWLLAVFTLVASFLGHPFWEDASEMNQFLKNLAVVGGLIILASTGPGALSVDGRRRS
jgi:putative oxidoreductase